MKNRAYFELYFPMIELTYMDDEHFIFEEKMIKKRRVQDEDWESIFIRLFKNYHTYYQMQSCDWKECSYSCKHLQYSRFTDRETQIVLYRQHGDLSTDNLILTDKGDVYLIDFDHGAFYPYYYDLFFLMLDLYVKEKNEIGFKLLIDGEFNSFLSDIPIGEAEPYSMREAFLLFANFYLDKCQRSGMGQEAQQKIKDVCNAVLKKM